MAISKKKKPKGKKTPKRAEPTAKKKASQGRKRPASPKRKPPSKAQKARHTPPKERSTQRAAERTSVDVGELERALAEALIKLQNMAEDRDTQAAIAEAADAERSMIADELEEARERIRELEQRVGEAPEPTVVGPSPDDALDYDEEEEEEESEDLDDVESIYSRMDDPRVRRQELDRERMDRESEVGDEPFWQTCPKCGGTLEEIDAGEVKIDRCENCAGLYLDQGEVEILLSITRGSDGMQRIRTILQY
jgi:hypothetical protein